MLLFHGSNDDNIEYFDSSHSEPGNDFGMGVYITNDLEKAKEWAIKKYKVGKSRVVYVSDISLNDNNFNVLLFDSNNDFKYIYYNSVNEYEEASEFIFNNFNDIDIICGPIIKNYDTYKYAMDVFHGEEDKNNPKYKELKKKFKKHINSIDELDKILEFWNNGDDIQYCLKSKRLEFLFNKGIKKLIYLNENQEIIKEQTLVFDESTNRILHLN